MFALLWLKFMALLYVKFFSSFCLNIYFETDLSAFMVIVLCNLLLFLAKNHTHTYVHMYSYRKTLIIPSHSIFSDRKTDFFFIFYFANACMKTWKWVRISYLCSCYLPVYFSPLFRLLWCVKIMTGPGHVFIFLFLFFFCTKSQTAK